MPSTLDTLRPDPDWDPDGYEEAIEVLGASGLVFKVWGGDWCIDCQRQLPPFAAALEAAGVDRESIEHYPVTKNDDGSKDGPGVDEYGIERIPTVVVERDGEAVARFVEEAAEPIALALAAQLKSAVPQE
ncbi:MAG: thioredoxin family protein [Halobacteriota archaeon]